MWGPGQEHEEIQASQYLMRHDHDDGNDGDDDDLFFCFPNNTMPWTNDTFSGD